MSAGGHWPQTARVTCKALVAQAVAADEDQSLSIKLLADIRQIFAKRDGAFLASAQLVAELRCIEDSPWQHFDMNPRKLAHRLKDFGGKPAHNTTETARGYSLEMFSDAFARYIRPDPSHPSIAARYRGGL